MPAAGFCASPEIGPPVAGAKMPLRRGAPVPGPMIQLGGDMGRKQVGVLPLGPVHQQITGIAGGGSAWAWTLQPGESGSKSDSRFVHELTHII